MGLVPRLAEDLFGFDNDFAQSVTFRAVLRFAVTPEHTQADAGYADFYLRFL